jgi:2-phospho-L-lactate guanylyltransferase (CobY/MobA/RfbA family)
MWLALPTEFDKDSKKPNAAELLNTVIEHESHELAQLIIRIQSKVSWLVDTNQDELIQDLNQLSGYFSPHDGENTETRDVRLSHVLLRVSRFHARSWSEWRRRGVEVRTWGWYTESVDKNTPISVDEILAIPASNRRREFRFLLVYGITSETLNKLLSRQP